MVITLLVDIETSVGLDLPIDDDFCILLMFDPKIRKFDNLITKKIIPVIREQAEKFVMPDD